jgi:hypothetical protein
MTERRAVYRELDCRGTTFDESYGHHNVLHLSSYLDKNIKKVYTERKKKTGGRKAVDELYTYACMSAVVQRA